MGIGCLKGYEEELKLWDGQRYIWITDATGMRGSSSWFLLFYASATSHPTAWQLPMQTAIQFLFSWGPPPPLSQFKKSQGKALISLTCPPWTNQQWPRQQTLVRTGQITPITRVRPRVREKENNFPTEGGYKFPEEKGKKSYHNPLLPRMEANEAFK